jgi:hypothetical protein
MKVFKAFMGIPMGLSDLLPRNVIVINTQYRMYGAVRLSLSEFCS